jgi:inner membrane protease subunit 2
VYTHAPYPHPVVTVPVYHVWVEGDNRDPSKTLDSHHYGPVSMALIEGKVTHIVWPRKSFGAIQWWQFKGMTRVIKGTAEEAPVFD